MKKIKLVLDYLGEIDKRALAQLPRDKFDIIRAARIKKTVAERRENIKSADAVYIRTDDFYSESILKSAQNLKLVAFGGTGYQQYVDADAAKRLGIAVMNAPGANAQSVAEYSVALMLDSVRKVTFYNSNMKSGKKKILITNEIASLEIGLIGHGNICQRIEKILTGGFGANVKYWDYADKKSTPLNKILSNSDIVFIAITETDATRGFLDSAKIAKMKAGAILINPARPNLVEPKALLAALKSGKIAAAAFDGLYESAIRDKYLKLPDLQFIVSPHIAARTKDALFNTDMLAMKNIAEFFRTGKSKFIVNGEKNEK